MTFRRAKPTSDATTECDMTSLNLCPPLMELLLLFNFNHQIYQFGNIPYCASYSKHQILRRNHYSAWGKRSWPQVSDRVTTLFSPSPGRDRADVDRGCLGACLRPYRRYGPYISRQLRPLPGLHFPLILTLSQLFQ